MNIYTLEPCNDYKSCFLVDKNNNTILDNFKFDEYEKHKYKRKIIFADTEYPIGDFSWYWGQSGTILISQKAKNIFEKNVNNIQYISVETPQFSSKNFYLINILNYEDVLDMSLSEYSTMINYVGEEVVHEIKSYKFKNEVKNLLIFKLKIKDKKRENVIFATDKFVKIIQDNNLTGIDFEKISEIK